MPTPNSKSHDIFLDLLDDEQSLTNHTDDNTIQYSLQDTELSLTQYLQTVQLVVDEAFAQSVWVKAEIRNLSSKGGHYYFELADKDEAGNITASCRGNLWRNMATSVIKRFEHSTGTRLDKGLTVLLKVRMNFHTQYGFALTILDIDPTYTLGDIAKKYQQSLVNLADNGLLSLNKSLPKPFDIQSVLVIAPENGAGLGDFRADADKLDKTSACCFHYQTATFQGNHAPQSIRQAIFDGLSRLKQQQISPDLLVIIRGGGAVGDLAYLNDYELSAFVAELPLPVWTGIGHERDKVLLDEVAHSSFDTPSKVIVAIREHLLYITNLAKTVFNQIQQNAQKQIQTTAFQLEQQFKKIEQLSKQQLIISKQQVNYQFNYLQQNSFSQINFAKQQINQLRQVILLQNPAKILAKGYAIVRDDKQKIVSTSKISTNQTLEIELKDGIVKVKTV